MANFRMFMKGIGAREVGYIARGDCLHVYDYNGTAVVYEFDRDNQKRSVKLIGTEEGLSKVEKTIIIGAQNPPKDSHIVTPHKEMEDWLKTVVDKVRAEEHESPKERVI